MLAPCSHLQVHRPYFVIADDEDSAVVVQTDLIPAGKRTEGRKKAHVLTHPETRQPQALTTFAMQPINRMHMPGEYMPVRMRIGLMLQGERSEQQRFGHYAYV